MIDVIGIGADGWAGLSPRARAVISRARTVVGSPRQLALLPDAPGQARVPLPSPLRDGLRRLLDDVGEERVAVLASGDPLVYGVGGTLIDLLGVDRVRVHPAVSSVTLAAAELGWTSDSFDVVRMTGDPTRLRRVLTAGRRVLVLSADETSPAAVADLLVRTGFGRSTLTVLSNLGSATQTRLDTDPASFAAGPQEVTRLNVVALTLVGPTGWSAVGGLPDEAFEHDGQLTKRDARASALARLGPVPGQLLWDVGAGAGSMAIEWTRADPRCAAVAIERDPARAARIARNSVTLGAATMRVITGAAPDALAGLPAPDAVFVGGGATVDGVIDTCWETLVIGGRLVVHGVTVETERLLIDRHAQLGGELIRLSVERVEPLGSFRGWTPARSIVQWSATKGSAG